ncbi:hypothetical protein PPL_06638 [Heterostelium album PN500]|uniref:Uncharacterized protein n=1 Tax=Heterostelium pallidum (strain ATCC 26659 / Pp 5 / PN500) TaxID=670386 RepID=D3BFA5_HETP5|nr:hypothetical protein PPL_06638 [Heterostelium album PN500]EFA79819.1 hypothetical protein PPL_06638 [Heterostelium album PN500]|eukprot:XP_020431940.1 hypothetical protein PPL_06638 [Heterostelium album PN500]
MKICTIIHNNKHPDHVNQYDHIDDIRQSLNNLYLSILDNVNNNKNKNNSSSISSISSIDNNFNDINNNDMPVESKINFTINSIWESLRSSTSVYDSLTTAENEIKQYFEQIHTFLINEEHRLKKPIINQKDAIIDQIDNNINHLKHLINIININNNIEHACGNGNDNDVDNTETPVKIPDITDLYSTTTIMNSIALSSSLQSFIKDNNRLFLNNNNNYFDIDESLKQNNNDSSSLLYDIIYKYNCHFTPTTTLLSTLPPANYLLSIEPPDLDQLKLTIEQSIQLERIEIKPITKTRTMTTTKTTENENKTQYIFSTHDKNGATLINLSQNDSIEQFDVDYNFYGATIIPVGQDIYVFGGAHNQKKWMKFSMRSRSFEIIGDIEGIDGGFSISACYDGRDHIYLLNGANQRGKIDRFNIQTMKFERYHILPEGHGQRSSMIFKGSLYSINYDTNKMLQLNMVNREITYHLIDIKSYSACNDNNGNFYISDCPKRSDDIKRFVKFNVERKRSVDLNPIPISNDILMYHRESQTSSYVYSITGTEHGNFKYSIETNQYVPFFQQDEFKRVWCPSTSISVIQEEDDDYNNNNNL